MFEYLQRLLPQSKLLRPAPLSKPFLGQNGAPQPMRSYVDDLRWLLQCSGVELHMPRIPVEAPKEEQLDENLLASVEGNASHSGLCMKLYRAQGPRCQRSVRFACCP